MPHKFSIVPIDGEKASVTFKCENCGRSLSVMKKDSGSSPYFEIGKDGQPQLTAIRYVQSHDPVTGEEKTIKLESKDSAERYIGECTK